MPAPAPRSRPRPAPAGRSGRSNGVRTGRRPTRSRKRRLFGRRAGPMSPPCVLVLHNEPVLPEGHPDYASEYEILETAATVGRVLEGAGYKVRRLGVGPDPIVLLEGLRRERP